MTTAVAVISGAASSVRAVCIGDNTSLTRSPPATTTTTTTWSRSRNRSSSVRLSCRTRRKTTCCEVALRSDYSNSNSNPTEEEDEEDEEDEEVRRNMAKVGSKVRVKAPLRVYHVAKAPDLEVSPEMEGVIKQYVGFWKGKRISPNYPFKVEFLLDGLGRGGAPLKFVVHLREDEFDILP